MCIANDFNIYFIESINQITAGVTGFGMNGDVLGYVSQRETSMEMFEV